MNPRTLLVAVCLAFCATAIAPPAPAAPAKKSGAAKLYRWVDKEGKVHYGDKIPAEYADQHKQQINSSGQVVKEIDGAMTPEQRAASEARKTADAAAKIQGETDKMLLGTYGNVTDMERARDSRLAALEGQITMSSSTVTSLERDIAHLEAQRSVAKDPKVMERLDQGLLTRRNELTSNQRHVVTRQQEIVDVRQQFTKDIARFRELTAQPAQPPQPAPPPPKR